MKPTQVIILASFACLLASLFFPALKLKGHGDPRGFIAISNGLAGVVLRLFFVAG